MDHAARGDATSAPRDPRGAGGRSDAASGRARGAVTDCKALRAQDEASAGMARAAPWRRAILIKPSATRRMARLRYIAPVRMLTLVPCMQAHAQDAAALRASGVAAAREGRLEEGRRLLEAGLAASPGDRQSLAGDIPRSAAVPVDQLQGVKSEIGQTAERIHAACKNPPRPAAAQQVQRQGDGDRTRRTGG